MVEVIVTKKRGKKLETTIENLLVFFAILCYMGKWLML